MISFVVPAHNEQASLSRTLRAIHESARAVEQPYEIIVVNDASTDATAEIARQHQARVVDVNHRQIAATRNSGGRAALGERIFFVDADTTINPRALASALRWMDKGAVGGGGPTVPGEGFVPIYIRLLAIFFVIGAKAVGFTGGAFMFCTRDAFQATGGFSERLFWAEEGSFALALKREGRFVVLWESVLTSGRRFRKVSGLQLLIGGVRMVFSPCKTFTRRASVEKIWYDSDRTDDDKTPNSLVTRVSNGVVLLIVLALLTGPLWNFVPKSLTPLTSPIGTMRFVVGTIHCHLGLLFWPFSIILLANLLRQKRCTGLIHSGALIAFSFWQAWGCLRCVFHIWRGVGLWLIGG